METEVSSPSRPDFGAALSSAAASGRVAMETEVSSPSRPEIGAVSCLALLRSAWLLEFLFSIFAPLLFLFLSLPPPSRRLSAPPAFRAPAPLTARSCCSQIAHLSEFLEFLDALRPNLATKQVH